MWREAIIKEEATNRITLSLENHEPVLRLRDRHDRFDTRLHGNSDVPTKQWNGSLSRRHPSPPAPAPHRHPVMLITLAKLAAK